AAGGRRRQALPPLPDPRPLPGQSAGAARGPARPAGAARFAALVSARQRLHGGRGGARDRARRAEGSPGTPAEPAARPARRPAGAAPGRRPALERRGLAGRRRPRGRVYGLLGADALEREVQRAARPLWPEPPGGADVAAEHVAPAAPGLNKTKRL